VALGEPRFDDDYYAYYAAKLALLSREAPAVVSFTFGCPAPAIIHGLQGRGCAVWVTVTEAGEARQAVDTGADALVIQGVEAGGRRGGFADHDEREDYGLLALLQLVRARVDVPLIAVGGIATGCGSGRGSGRRSGHGRVGNGLPALCGGGDGGPASGRGRLRTGHGANARLHRPVGARHREPPAGRA